MAWCTSMWLCRTTQHWSSHTANRPIRGLGKHRATEFIISSHNLYTSDGTKCNRLRPLYKANRHKAADLMSNLCPENILIGLRGPFTDLRRLSKQFSSEELLTHQNLWMINSLYINLPNLPLLLHVQAPVNYNTNIIFSPDGNWL